MIDPSPVAQTITISHNIAITAGFAIAFAGFLLGYAIGWRQRNYRPVAPQPVAFGPCEMPLTADELERLRLYRLMNPTDMHP
ncbi:hypothetical protein CV770_18440 [Bradyrhizobium sp. AC87j1]|uniref:hypothetical protein n=1 Tax=Bradyrhizobium sp. AC87j1 TaxID=2055894 RepID=UPI000CEC4493|nr:hypothetical protein [Bradyrhizobium sp. AC87j1]PPQ17946.1 hypothetical protein CV770_18440 [Bradyrhizobium sp. AC87j1]